MTAPLQKRRVSIIGPAMFGLSLFAWMLTGAWQIGVSDIVSKLDNSKQNLSKML
ncbi:MAG: hypothetical protein JXR76_14930 [Deltaproteobacteria bacterium]|nr:hypothetical protein [Deltaproteobacteria bacterium]